MVGVMAACTYVARRAGTKPYSPSGFWLSCSCWLLELSAVHFVQYDVSVAPSSESAGRPPLSLIFLFKVAFGAVRARFARLGLGFLGLSLLCAACRFSKAADCTAAVRTDA
jgi:hypothetical protein